MTETDRKQEVSISARMLVPTNLFFIFSNAFSLQNPIFI